MQELTKLLRLKTQQSGLTTTQFMIRNDQNKKSDAGNITDPKKNKRY